MIPPNSESKCCHHIVKASDCAVLPEPRRGRGWETHGPAGPGVRDYRVRRLGVHDGYHRPPSAASGNVCPGDDAAESFVVGVVVAPDDVAADHAALLLVGGVVGAVEREVAQCGELRLYAV